MMARLYLPLWGHVRTAARNSPLIAGAMKHVQPLMTVVLITEKNAYATMDPHLLVEKKVNHVTEHVGFNPKMGPAFVT